MNVDQTIIDRVEAALSVDELIILTALTLKLDLFGVQLSATPVTPIIES